MLSILKSAYRSLVPAAVRNSRAVAGLKARVLGHDRIYSREWYEQEVEGPALRSAGRIAASIVAELAPRSVVDVGCGTGALLQALRERGCEVFGLEYAEAALRYCRARALEVEKFDLEKDAFAPARSFDVAVSMEVAEHLPARAADRYVELLARLAPIIVFTAAPPGQGGTDHVNEQPPAYWMAKFRARGFAHDAEQSLRWREVWAAAGDVAWWYHQNLMIFRR